jgi:DNA-directed RNA polymerase subunit beta
MPGRVRCITGAVAVIPDFATLVMPRRNLNDLRSYAHLLERGALDTLTRAFPIHADASTSLHLVSCRSSREAGAVAFVARIQIRAVDEDGEEQVVADEELPIGHLPELTEACTIVVDGVAHAPRLALEAPSHRLPGVQFWPVSDPPGYRAWFLPFTGHHLAIVLDADGCLIACIDNQCTVPLAVLLRALDCPPEHWPAVVPPPTGTRTEAISEIGLATLDDVMGIEDPEKLFHRFFGPERNQLSTLGRMRIAYRLKLDVPFESQQITVQDVVAATHELVRVARGEAPVDPVPASIDAERHRIRTIGELFEARLFSGLLGVTNELMFQDLYDRSIPDLVPSTLVTDAADAVIAKHFAPVRTDLYAE